MTAVSAAIFDVDGVLVASPHERAWREAVAAYVKAVKDGSYPDAEHSFD